MTDPYVSYDYAWQQPGWTSQNNVVPPDDDVPVPPSGLFAVHVVGEFFDQTGHPIEAVVSVRPSVDQVRVGNKTVSLQPIKIRATRGTIEDLYVLRPDGSELCYPPTWTYHFHQRVGLSDTEYDLVVPNPDDTVNVFDLQTDSTPTVVSEFPIQRDYEIPAGTTFRREFVLTGFDLSTWTAKMQIRSSVGGTLLLELTETSGITITALGEIGIEITAEQTTALAAGVYDLELYEPLGDTIRFLEGAITISPNVTI